MHSHDPADGHPLSLHTLLVVARSVHHGPSFRAEDAFLLLREARRLCPIALPDVLSEPRVSALERAADRDAFVAVLARCALAELIARLDWVDGQGGRGLAEASVTRP